jgi:hypothetical protein
MVRPMCSARAMGLAALTTLWSLAGCANGDRGGYDKGNYSDSQDYGYRPRPYGYYQPQELYQYRRHEFRSDGNYCYYHGCDSRNVY